MGLNYYHFHIGDYAKDTRHLTMLEDGAYRRLLDLYYSTEKPFVLGVDNLCVLVGARTAADKKAVKSVLSQFFVFGEGSELRHKRCDAEIAKAKEKSVKAASSAEYRWQSKRSANALPPQSEGNAPNSQYPITNKNQWWKSDDGIKAKGEELGVPTRPGESYQEYKQRLFDEIHRRKKRAA